jgi:hypothetical protein
MCKFAGNKNASGHEQPDASLVREAYLPRLSVPFISAAWPGKVQK